MRTVTEILSYKGFHGIENVLRYLSLLDSGKIILTPFMLVSGSHLEKDLAGHNDSWKAAFE